MEKADKWGGRGRGHASHAAGNKALLCSPQDSCAVVAAPGSAQGGHEGTSCCWGSAGASATTSCSPLPSSHPLPLALRSPAQFGLKESPKFPCDHPRKPSERFPLRSTRCTVPARKKRGGKRGGTATPVTRRRMEVAISGGDGPVRRDVSPKVMQLVRPCPEPRPLLLPSGKIREKFSSSRREKKNKRQKKRKKKAKQTPRPLFGETTAAARSDGIYFALGNSIHSGSGCGREG